MPQKTDKKKAKKAVSEDEEVVDTVKLMADLTAAGINAEAAIEPVVEPTPAPTVTEAAATSTGRKKKKKGSEAPTLPAAGPAGDAPKPQRQQTLAKEETVVPPPVKEEKSSAPDESQTVSNPASNIAFDELGDTWKEAKAPKKSQKKKTRVD